MRKSTIRKRTLVQAADHAREIRYAILRNLRGSGPTSYNLLFDKVHQETRCGRNLFNSRLKKLREEEWVLSAPSKFHKSGTMLEINPEMYPDIREQGFRLSAEAIVTYLFPFAEARETGSIEEQQAWWDLKRLLPFKMKIELVSNALEGQNLTAHGKLDEHGNIIDLETNLEELRKKTEARKL